MSTILYAVLTNEADHHLRRGFIEPLHINDDGRVTAATFWPVSDDHRSVEAATVVEQPTFVYDGQTPSPEVLQSFHAARAEAPVGAYTTEQLIEYVHGLDEALGIRAITSHEHMTLIERAESKWAAWLATRYPNAAPLVVFPYAMHVGGVDGYQRVEGLYRAAVVHVLSEVS